MLAVHRKAALRIGLLIAIALVVLIVALFYFNTENAQAFHAETAPPGCYLADVDWIYEYWICEGPAALEATDGAYCVIVVVWDVGDAHVLVDSYGIQVECPEPGAPQSPGIWSADVCENIDGFSSDGWTTVDSDANVENAWGTTLYVAAGPDGPWFATEFYQPPYVISLSQMEALTAMVGLTDYHDLWMRAGEGGIAANFGSMLEDRAAHMDDLCGTE